MSIVAVAKKAGVSIATVSRVLNGLPVVQERTAQEVRKAVAELGYKPLRIRRPKPGAPHKGYPRVGTKIAVFAVGANPRWLEMPVLASVLTGIVNAARGQGLQVALEEVPDSRSIHSVSDISGGIAFVDSNAEESLVKVLAAKVPLVRVMGGDTPRSCVDQVLPNNTEIGHLAHQYLAREGCTEYAFLTDQPLWPLMRGRGQSFANASSDAGQQVTTHLVMQGQSATDSYPNPAFRHATIRDAIASICEKRNGKLGLFIPTDLLTSQVQPMLVERGARVGEEIKIISCDNEAVRLSLLNPPPPSIDLSCADIGRIAVQQLINRLNDPAAPTVRVQVSPSLRA